MQILESLHGRTQGSVSSLLSPEVVLVGQTNAGKSSLFNLLVKHNRSIVSSIAGTTRDYISEVIHIDGTNFKLVDTAGIRDSLDFVENIGIDRAFEILNKKLQEAAEVEEEKPEKKSKKEEKSTIEKISENTMVRQVGRTVFKEVARGLLGVLGLGGKGKKGWF